MTIRSPGLLESELSINVDATQLGDNIRTFTIHVTDIANKTARTMITLTIDDREAMMQRRLASSIKLNSFRATT